MPRRWIVCILVALAPVLALIPSGCVPPGDVGVALLVTPETLDFGKTTDQLSFEVSKIYSATQLQPVIATPGSPWIVIEDCNDADDQCLSVGPLLGKKIRVSVRRDQMSFGGNWGKIFLTSGGASVRTLDVTAEDSLQAAFAVDRRQPEAGQPIQFTDLSLAEDDIISRTWDFGDGTTSNAINPVHSYPSDGSYTISLTVRTRNAQETFTSPAFVTVQTGGTRVDFVADRTNIVVDELVYFTDLTVSPSAPVTAHFWDFGDGGTSTVANPNHQFRSVGPKTVTLRVTTAQGQTTTTKQNYILVQSKLKPKAKIAIGQLKPFVDKPVQFTDVSDAGTSPILSRVWEFGDSFASSQANPLHTFRNVGNFVVKLTVITEHGTDTATLPIEVIFQPPVADFAVNNTNPDVFQFIQFTDRSLAGSTAVSEWAWDFGDGKTSTARNPQHRYTLPGTYSVSLRVRTPLPTNNEASITKEDLIVVVTPPAPNFNYTPRAAYVDQAVQFQNTTTLGSELQVTYKWDFDGDPTTTTDTSTAQNPTYTFRNAGTFNTTLTVTTPSRARTFAQAVVVDSAPVADFNATPRTGTTVDPIAFTDATRAGVDGANKAIVSRSWAFGDGETSTATNPSHLYDTAGTYDVALTVTYAHSGTGETFTSVRRKDDFVTITNPNPPVANFAVAASCALVGTPIGFEDLSEDGTRPTTNWFWRFGDGGTSTSPSPTHVYNQQGEYTVTLTVTSAQLPGGFNTSTTSQTIFVTEVQDLDDFVYTDDPAYQYSLINSFPLRVGTAQIATAFNLYMVSQTWRSAAEIYTGNYDGRVWNHNVTIIQPTKLTTDTGILLISGGDRFDGPPSASDLVDSSIGLIAAATGATVTVVSNVPAQPIQFNDDFVDGLPSDRSEDAILAYSFDKYMETVRDGNRDVTWPALFPMTKAAVRTMDTVQDFLDARGVSVNDFIITGGSKRGWTTWLTGITDCRVKGIAPLVIDLLNIDQTVPRQLDVYGEFAPTLGDYVTLGVFDRFVPGPDGNPPADGQSLIDLIDPYEYRERIRVPKLIINSTGDEFFLPDSSQFYIGDLKGETRLSYLPNTSHGLTELPDLSQVDNVASVLTSWSLSLIQDVPRPTVDWTFPDANTIEVQLATPVPAGSQVSLWQATNPTDRDFRLQTIGNAYRPTVLTSVGGGLYRATVVTPTSGYRAFFIQVRIPSAAEPALTVPGAPDPTFVFSTPVRVVPDTFPF